MQIAMSGPSESRALYSMTGQMECQGRPNTGLHVAVKAGGYVRTVQCQSLRQKSSKVQTSPLVDYALSSFSGLTTDMIYENRIPQVLSCSSPYFVRLLHVLAGLSKAWVSCPINMQMGVAGLSHIMIQDSCPRILSSGFGKYHPYYKYPYAKRTNGL